MRTAASGDSRRRPTTRSSTANARLRADRVLVFDDDADDSADPAAAQNESVARIARRYSLAPRPPVPSLPTDTANYERSGGLYSIEESLGRLDESTRGAAAVASPPPPPPPASHKSARPKKAKRKRNAKSLATVSSAVASASVADSSQVRRQIDELNDIDEGFELHVSRAVPSGPVYSNLPRRHTNPAVVAPQPDDHSSLDVSESRFDELAEGGESLQTAALADGLGDAVVAPAASTPMCRNAPLPAVDGKTALSPVLHDDSVATTAADASPFVAKIGIREPTAAAELAVARRRLGVAFGRQRATPVRRFGVSSTNRTRSANTSTRAACEPSKNGLHQTAVSPAQPVFDDSVVVNSPVLFASPVPMSVEALATVEARSTDSEPNRAALFAMACASRRKKSRPTDPFNVFGSSSFSSPAALSTQPVPNRIAFEKVRVAVSVVDLVSAAEKADLPTDSGSSDAAASAEDGSAAARTDNEDSSDEDESEGDPSGSTSSSSSADVSDDGAHSAVDESASAQPKNFSRLSVGDLSGSPYYLRGRARVKSPMDDLLFVCSQPYIFTWDVLLNEQFVPSAMQSAARDATLFRMLNACKKIGEGVYGEVFRTRNADGMSVALKVIPIEGSLLVNDEKQKTFDEILPEVLIAKEMSALRDGSDANVCSTPNFIEVVSVGVVKGAYPAPLLHAWDDFDARRRSENDRPDAFDDEQLFVVFEFADGGTDLDNFKLRSVQEALSLVGQVLWALAIAEQTHEFEHRDLHIGNVLVKRTTRRWIEYKYGGTRDDAMSMWMRSHGVHAYIIDFTNSRLRKQGCTIFTDLAQDDAMFDGPRDEYQFDIYRMMRRHNDNDWKAFEPKSNIFWLHYLIDKLISVKKYNGRRLSTWRASLLQNVMDEMLDFASCKTLLAGGVATDKLLNELLPKDQSEVDER